MSFETLLTKTRRQRPSCRSWAISLLGTAVLQFAPVESGAATRSEPQGQLSFGLIADIQYADKDSSGRRGYRESLAKLDRCLIELNRQPLAFVANLGDSIDGRDDQSMADLERVMDVLAQSHAPVRHVVGNHCLEVPRRQLLPALGLAEGYYAFQSQDWQFLVLDTMEVSLKAEPDTEQRREAEAWVDLHPELPTYNGAVGPTQLVWLRTQLAEARQAQRRIIVLSHHPLATLPGRESPLSWNASVVRQLLAESGCVVACFAGHDHAGAYVLVDGVHYLTVPGLVEAPTNGIRCAMVDVFHDRLELRGLGDVPSRTLPFTKP